MGTSTSGRRRRGEALAPRGLLAALLAAGAVLAAACGDGGATAPDAAADLAAATDVGLSPDAPGPSDVVAADAVRDAAVDTPAPLDAMAPGDTAPDALVPGDAAVDTDAAPAPWWEGLAPAPTGVTLRALLGVASHMSQGVAPDARRDFELDAYESLGGIGFREHFRWDDGEPENDRFEFAGYDVQVALAKEHGCELLPMVGYDVAWAQQVPGEDSSIRPADFEDYAFHVAEHFCADIRTYEIWNEPNLYVFWEPEPDPAAYGALLKAAARGIRAACPGARVGTGGVAFWDLRHWDADWGFLRELSAAHPDICDAFDVAMVHPYTWLMQRAPEYDGSVGAIQTPGYVEMIRRLRAWLADAGCPDRPIVYTEAGWPSWGLGEELQARWLARGYLLSAHLGVERYHWYTFWDSEPDPREIPQQDNWFGLFAWPGEDGSVRQEKPAFAALRGLVTVLGDARFVGDLSAALELPEDVWALAFRSDAGALTVAAWDGRDDPDGALQPPTGDGTPTFHDARLPLPPDATGVTVFDRAGAIVASHPADGPLTLRLGPSPVYVRIER